MTPTLVVRGGHRLQVGPSWPSEAPNAVGREWSHRRWNSTRLVKARKFAHWPKGYPAVLATQPVLDAACHDHRGRSRTMDFKCLCADLHDWEQSPEFSDVGRLLSPCPKPWTGGRTTNQGALHLGYRAAESSTIKRAACWTGSKADLNLYPTRGQLPPEDTSRLWLSTLNIASPNAPACAAHRFPREPRVGQSGAGHPNRRQ